MDSSILKIMVFSIFCFSRTCTLFYLWLIEGFALASDIGSGSRNDNWGLRLRNPWNFPAILVSLVKGCLISIFSATSYSSCLHSKKKLILSVAYDWEPNISDRQNVIIIYFGRIYAISFWRNVCYFSFGYKNHAVKAIPSNINKNV